MWDARDIWNSRNISSTVLYVQARAEAEPNDGVSRGRHFGRRSRPPGEWSAKYEQRHGETHDKCRPARWSTDSMCWAAVFRRRLITVAREVPRSTSRRIFRLKGRGDIWREKVHFFFLQTIVYNCIKTSITFGQVGQRVDWLYSIFYNNE